MHSIRWGATASQLMSRKRSCSLLQNRPLGSQGRYCPSTEALPRVDNSGRKREWPCSDAFFHPKRLYSTRSLFPLTPEREKNMETQEDVIVDMPKERVKFFGGFGKMLLPSPKTVAALIEKIPEHKLITTHLLCQELTRQFKVQGTCPVTT